MDAMVIEKPELIRELHKDLARKYELHGRNIERIWHSFDRSQRTKVMKAGVVDDGVLNDPMDKSMGNVYKFMPEWNLRDITKPGSDYFLDLLKHRATKSLHEHMLINNLQHVEPFPYCFTSFIDEETYGKSFEIIDPDNEEAMASFSVAVDAGIGVPQSIGELILMRQESLLQALNIAVEDILDGSEPRNKNERTRKPMHTVNAAISRLSIDLKRERPSLPDLIASAVDQKSSLEDYLDLFRTEPVFLAHHVNRWFFSRPGLVQDENGRYLPVYTDRYISIAIFEMINSTVTAASSWNYLHRLLQLFLEKQDDKIYKTIILREISNICHLEYIRVQKNFKRYVQSGSGSKYFKRATGVYDDGIAHISMKIQPESLTKENPQLHYLLRLCQASTDATKAVVWIKNIDGLHQSHPSERDTMTERELDSFGDLAVISSFIQSLSALLPLPPVNLKNAKLYVSKSKQLAAELDSLKTQIDLSDFAVPIDNLLEPGMAESALDALDRFIVNKTGTKMRILYQNLIEDCISDIQDNFQEQKAKLKLAPPGVTPPIETCTTDTQVQQRRQKQKTHSTHSSAHDITPTLTSHPEAVQTPPVFKVKQDTIDVFSTLFLPSKSRGSISWTAFEAAMTDLKFSVEPKFGSVFTFLPPQDMAVRKSVTLHRPHQSRIEGYKLLLFARRLKRVYGWSERCFELV
ncbi:hypothetical protein B7463_g12281, partial [Scytalidium lignicola]